LNYAPEGYVSVLSTAYFFPITALLEKLTPLKLNEPNEVQTSNIDNGYSVSIIVLSVLLLESAIGKTQFVQNKQPPMRPVEFVASEYPQSGFSDKIEELFVVRDVIAHNHLWEAQFQWDDQLGMKFVSPPVLRSGYGDPKFRRVIDPSDRTTRLLGINLFPTRIHRADATIVLKTTVEFLLFLQSQNKSYTYMSPSTVRFNGEAVSFVDLVANL